MTEKGKKHVPTVPKKKPDVEPNPTIPPDKQLLND
jgi:hypothetical protein